MRRTPDGIGDAVMCDASDECLDRYTEAVARCRRNFDTIRSRSEARLSDRHRLTIFRTINDDVHGKS